MRYLTCIAMTLASAAPALAETKMTPERFEAFTGDSTVYFSRHGAPYGAEQYLPDRKVIWSFLDGTCQRGVWYGAGEAICFVYDTQPDPQCWHFLDDGEAQRARLLGDPPEDDLVVVGQDRKPLVCPGPDVGVSYTPLDF